jgi:hypothetical protein
MLMCGDDTWRSSSTVWKKYTSSHVSYVQEDTINEDKINNSGFDYQINFSPSRKK